MGENRFEYMLVMILYFLMPPDDGFCFACGMGVRKLEAYHQYLVEHPETLLARHQQDGPNASGVWILDREFGW